MGGMGWTTQEVPPLAVATTAAPLGAPAVPTVEPTAQHRRAETQSTASRELTGAGSATGARVPNQGDPGAMVEDAADPWFGPPVEQAAATSATKAAVTHTTGRAARDRPAEVVRRRTRGVTAGRIGISEP